MVALWPDDNYTVSRRKFAALLSSFYHYCLTLTESENFSEKGLTWIPISIVTWIDVETVEYRLVSSIVSRAVIMVYSEYVYSTNFTI